MCGIVGFVHRQAKDPETIVSAMADTMRLRGPDDSGLWSDRELGVALAHRRLSILDLSPEGHQPMMSRSRSGRYVIVFNGEIYNFLELKQMLQGAGHQFYGGSDTEVMLSAFEEWGVEEALKRFVGMFAFALWDKETRCLSLARDRIGEKPLYFGWSGGVFLFASELKALRKHPLFRAEIDRDALALYLRNNYIPSPWSIYRGIYKLLPGSFLQLTLDDLYSGSGLFSPWPEDRDKKLRPCRYWSAKEAYRPDRRFEGDDKEALERLEKILSRAVGQQMIADVPLGAFLSGGIDSSAIVALMQAQASGPVKTFSIGFYEGAYNEAPYAKEVAKHLGTAHTELYVTPKDALDVIPLLPSLYDEPFSDSSQIPTFLVSKLARQHVTVSLSGDGGDELFGGYPRFLWANKIWQVIGKVPPFMRTPFAAGLRTPSSEQWDRAFSAMSGYLPESLSFKNPGYKAYKLADVLSTETREGLYEKLLTHWDRAEEVVRGALALETVIGSKRQWLDTGGYIEWMMFIDLISYLPDDIMVKVDRASMGVSLESRAPFLDHRVVEFVASLPLSMKIRGDKTKWLLRELLDRYVPRDLIERRKMGFGVPVDQWIRGPLKDWAGDLLSEKRLEEQGYFRPAAIRRKWDEHIAEKKNWAYDLWDILMFQAWLDGTATSG